MRPVVVIVTAYNAQEFLAEALDSVLAQTFRDWSAVVVNDGSTDGTESIALEYAGCDPRITVLSTENKGVSAARNAGTAALEGDYFAFLDADDVWQPEKLERQLAHARRHSADFVYCGYEAFGPGAGPAGSPDWEVLCHYHDGPSMHRLIAERNFILPSCVLYSAALRQAVGEWDESLSSASDWDLWFRIAKSGYGFYGIPERLCYYRCHSVSLSRRWDTTFWNNLRVFGNHLPEDMRSHPSVRHFFRLIFRNSFTLAGDQGRFGRLDEMFLAYRFYDPDGYAGFLMALLRRLLPCRAWWFVSRYVVIPLAWRLERLGTTAVEPCWLK